MSPLIYDGVDHPVEIAAGRGDLRYSSVPVGPSAKPASLALAGGKQVSYAQLFASQTWVAAAVMRLLSWSIRVPLKAYRRTGDDSRERLSTKEHPVARAIAAPWDRAGTAHLTMGMLGPVLIHGNSLLEVQDGASDKLRFRQVDWRFANPITPWRDTVSGWDIDQDDKTMARTLAKDDIVHVAWWSPLGPLGVSPLQQLGTTIAVEDAAQRHQRAMLVNGARTSAAIKMSSELVGADPAERAEAMQIVREDLDALYTGPENAGRPALLPPGLEWQPAGQTAVEAALIDQRRLTREEVCAVYQIPPPMLAILDRATFSNIEVQREMAYTDSLAPPLVLVEQTINAQLVRGLRRDEDVYVEYDFAGVLRGDRLKEVQALREAISTALLTPNEARAIDNRPKSDDPAMDRFYAPTNNLGAIAGPGVSDDPSEPAGPSGENAAGAAGASAADPHPAPVGA